MRRVALAIASVTALVLGLSAPANANTMFNSFGFGFTSPTTTFTPLQASTLTNPTLFSATDLVTAPALNMATMSTLDSFSVVSDLATASDVTANNAEIARQAAETSAQQRAAAMKTSYAAACPSSVPAGSLRAGAESIGAYELCSRSVAAAPTQEAASAIAWAFTKLGAPYACGGVGRMEEFRFDCSSLVSRAYAEGAGVSAAGGSWSPTTRQMVPWGGSSLASWLTPVDPSAVAPGDLLTYDTGGVTYRHVVMALADGYMLHTNACGDVAHVTTSWGTGNGFLGARRVQP